MTIIPGVSDKEFNYYLSEFRKAKYFGAIKAGGECLNKYLIDSLKKLHCLELYPIPVHGGGEQINAALKKRGLKSEIIDGKRVTDERTLNVVVNTLNKINHDFVGTVNRKKKYAEGLTKIFYGHGYDKVYGYVGEAKHIAIDRIDSCLQRKLIPIISPLGFNMQGGNQGRYFNQNADTAFKLIVSKLKPMKVIMLTPPGGVYENVNSRKIISEMNKGQLERFIGSGNVHGGMMFKLKHALELLELGFDVQITSPEHLMRELFSKKGCGTYIHSG